MLDKLRTRLRVGLSHLRKHKFRHNFQDTIDPLCSCSPEIESTSYFFLCCQNFITPRTNLMNEFRKLYSNFLNLDEISQTKLHLYGYGKYENNVNKKILLASINFILSTKRCERPPDLTFFLNICLLAIFPSFYLCIFYALRFCILPSLHGHS